MAEYSDWQNNVGGDEVVVNVEVSTEEDTPALLLTSTDLDLDILIEDDAAAQDFFTSVAEAKVKWDGLR